MADAKVASNRPLSIAYRKIAPCLPPIMPPIRPMPPALTPPLRSHYELAFWLLGPIGMLVIAFLIALALATGARAQTSAPIEPDAVLIASDPGTLKVINDAVQLVRSDGYRCDTVSGFRPLIFSTGFELICNRFEFTYDLRDKGRGVQVSTP